MVAPAPRVHATIEGMTRRHALPLAALFAVGGCRTQPPLAPGLLPEASGPWHRTSQSDPPVSEAPDAVPRASVARFRRASYEGAGGLEARVYLLESQALALDLVQRWRPAPDTVFFYAGRFFAVVQWREADRGALRTFVQDLERRLRAAS
jgi:hypothetical protein